MISLTDPRLWYKLFIGIYMAGGCVYFATSLLKQPFPWKKTTMIVVLGSLVSWGWNIVGSINSDFYMSGFYASFIILLILVYRQNWKNAIFLALIHYFTIASIPRVMWWLYRTVGGRVRIEGGVAYWDEPWIHILTASLMFLFIYFIRKQISKISNYELQNKEFTLIMIMTLPYVFFSYTLTILDANLDLPLGIIIIWAILSIGVILNMVIGRRQQQELDELRIIEKHLQEQYQRHLMKVETSDLIMQKCHDLQKHLRLFQETKNQNYLETYQEELKATINDFDSVYETGNPLLDTVLSEASRKCQTNNIHLICLVDGTLIKFIEPIDIFSIFGNALDNAIESSLNLPDEKKIIQLKIYQENFLLLIRISNYYEHPLIWSDGMPQTNKPDKANHGYGLKSITYTAEKYGGKVNIDTEDGKFTLTILFNL